MNNTTSPPTDVTPVVNHPAASAYGQLLRALVPAAQFVALSRHGKAPMWSSDNGGPKALISAAREAFTGPAAAPFEIGATRRGVTDDGRAINIFRLHDLTGDIAAVVALSHPTFFGERPLSELESIIRPALDCLSRDLALCASLGQRVSATPPTQSDVPLVLDVVRQEQGIGCQGYELSQFVETALQRLNGTVATLVVPEKGIAIVKRRTGATPQTVSQIVSRSHRQLMSWATQQGRPLVMNDPAGARHLPPCRVLSVRVRNASGRTLGFLAFFNEATGAQFTGTHVRLAQAFADRAETILQCNYDNLTGLSSRSAFERDGEVLFHHQSGDAAVIYFDIDGMGLINERASMLVGDAVIREVAATLKRNGPREALTARLAGDRFAALLPHCNVARAREVATAVANAVRGISATTGSIPFQVSVSTGVAAVSATSSEPLAHALAVAEGASKRTKGHPAAGATAAPGAAPGGRRETMAVADILAWLRADRFELHAQPVLALGQATSVPRFEILLRGLSPDNRALMPGKLLESAASHGLMSAIDAWVIERAFRELATKQQELQSRAARFSINLSRHSLQDDTLPDLIERAWRRSSIPADVLCFEVSEASVAANPERAVRVMHRLRRIGFSVALDDAGSMALTPTQITALPINTLKIDGALVRSALVEPEARNTIRYLVGLARNMSAQSVAVSVESDDIRRLMVGAGADYGQGFAIGRPTPLATVLQSVAVYDEAHRRGAGPLTKAGYRIFKRH